MSRCSQLVGTGVIQYPCIVDHEPHEGPCAAVEIPSSTVRRQQWLAKNKQATQPVPVIFPGGNGQQPPQAAQSPQVASSPVPAPDAASTFSDHDKRLSMAADSIAVDYDHLPVVIKSWMMGASAQFALVALWNAWAKAQAAGEQHLVLVQADIEALVPDKLRVITQ